MDLMLLSFLTFLLPEAFLLPTGEHNVKYANHVKSLFSLLTGEMLIMLKPHLKNASHWGNVNNVNNAKYFVGLLGIESHVINIINISNISAGGEQKCSWQGKCQ